MRATQHPPCRSVNTSAGLFNSGELVKQTINDIILNKLVQYTVHVLITFFISNQDTIRKNIHETIHFPKPFLILSLIFIC